MGLEDKILKNGLPHREWCQWHRGPQTPGKLDRLFKVPFALPPARYEGLITNAQVESRVLFRGDIIRFGGSDVMYKPSLIDIKIDEEDTKFPVWILLEH